MSNYGRNFDFRVSPRGGQRAGRYFLNEVAAKPIGAPVLVGTAKDSYGCVAVTLATGETAKPLPGDGGILVYEHGPNAYAGLDPVLTQYSDLSTVPAKAHVQVVSGSEVKVAFKNTENTTFLTARSYTGRTMVDEIGTPSTVGVAIGDWLTPGAGNDTDGYWAKTTTAANAWLVVTDVNTDTGEVEARLNF